jgi:CRISPR-associated endonuclease/helicase Cas3
MRGYLARSSPRQTYREHIKEVLAYVRQNLCALTLFISREKAAILNRVSLRAAEYHDLGKLEEQNQEVLWTDTDYRRHLPIEHRDAGVAYLLGHGDSEVVTANEPAAILVAAGHWPGLFDLRRKRLSKDSFRFGESGDTVAATNKNLEQYLHIHRAEVPSASLPATDSLLNYKQLSPLDYRMALSCCVDADYTSSSGKKPLRIEPRWAERIDALDVYVEQLQELAEKQNRDMDHGLRHNSDRMDLRAELYRECREAGTCFYLTYCDGPVGIGKTTAVLAHLLRVANERGFRHIFIVAPYLAIITQIVKVCREALVLEGEDPQSTVAEHHHQADYENEDLRYLATTWTAPIIVTTAVQFFETLASNQPSRLRKLHELAGSAVFIDESHAALPPKLMPLAWNWMRQLTEDWGCYFCLCSGTFVRFWEAMPEKFPLPEGQAVTSLISCDLQKRLESHESSRVAMDIMKGGVVLHAAARAASHATLRITPYAAPHFKGMQSLIAFITSKPGPRLVVMNTVQSAAALALKMRDIGHDVLHLSTALTPADRECVMNTVLERLKNPEDSNWTLVATSGVECGINVSFRTGFAEMHSLSSLIQISGRVGRHGEYADASLFCFTASAEVFAKNPAFSDAIEVFEELISSGRLSEPLSELSVSEAIRDNFVNEQKKSEELRNDDISRFETLYKFETVAQKFNVIEDETTVVIVDAELRRMLAKGISVDAHELQRGSVSLRKSVLDKLSCYEIGGQKNLLALSEDQYDSFIGYMKGVLSGLGIPE